MISGPVVLEARGSGRRRPDGAGWLISDVSLSIAAGQRLAIVGATGSGKTLLLRALALLDPLDAGQVLWHGQSVPAGQVTQFRRQVIYLQQRAVLIDGKVEDNLRLPFTLRANAGAEFDRRQALDRLALLGRDEAFLRRSQRDLSGGEGQLVAFLRALQLEPAVLLLDEPTASLDAESARGIEALVRDWHQRAPGMRAYVWVSHDRAQAERVSNRLRTMTHGQLDAEDSS